MTTSEVPPIDADVRQEIAGVLVRYASGIDQRDWVRFRTCFTDDCVADYGDIGVWNGADALTSWMEQAHQGAGHTMHRITNEAVVADRDVVRARCYVDAIVMGADNLSGVRAVGLYDDVFVHTPRGWQIEHRRFTSVLLEAIGSTAAG